MSCEHKWELENFRTELPIGTLYHAAVVCQACHVFKAPIKFGEYVVQGSQAEKERDSGKERGTEE